MFFLYESGRSVIPSPRMSILPDGGQIFSVSPRYFIFQALKCIYQALEYKILRGKRIFFLAGRRHVSTGRVKKVCGYLLIKKKRSYFADVFQEDRCNGNGQLEDELYVKSVFSDIILVQKIASFQNQSRIMDNKRSPLLYMLNSLCRRERCIL